MELNSVRIHTYGSGDGPIGFFAERRANLNMVCESDHGKQINAILDAGDTLTIKPRSDQNSTEFLAIGEGVEWFNNPIKVDGLLGEADDLLFKVRNGF